MLNWHAKHKEGLSLGQKAADAVRNGMGSWIFVGSFSFSMAAWMLLNASAMLTKHWDPFPFILLNLVLSTLAALQGAILLIAAKRQDQVSAALAQHDYEINLQAGKDIGWNNQKTKEILSKLEDLERNFQVLYQEILQIKGDVISNGQRISISKGD